MPCVLRDTPLGFLSMRCVGIKPQPPHAEEARNAPSRSTHKSDGWVARESPTLDAAAVNKMQDLVQAFFSVDHCKTERITGRDGLGDVLKVTAGPANGERPILVMSHVDTVHPLKTIEHDLPLRRDGDRLFGPGIYDMKGGAYLAAEAFRMV
eukprot:gene42020-55758_t